MYLLRVNSGPDRGKIVELKPGSICDIGRENSSCQLELRDGKVSRLHSRFTVKVDGALFLEDQGSTNGTYLRGGKIGGRVTVNTGDVILVGETELCVIKKDAPPGGGIRNGAAAQDPSSKPPGEGAYSPAGRYTRRLELGERKIRIGRDPSNDLVLDHPAVSRRHASILFQGDRHFLQDLDSVNGTYINGGRVAKIKELEPGSLIQICGYRYIFDGYNLTEYDENAGMIRIEVRGLGKSIHSPSGSKKLLDDVNFRIEPKEFVAILGGSGAGKTTLLRALLGIQPATSGEILINGRNYYREYDIFRTIIGYVPQENIVHLDLTAEEVLTYSARLRMPDDTAADEINARVNRVLELLDLAERRDIPVRHLSGGQQKRVSIGVELLTKPSLFFLDEPTSGLDPGLEKLMMETLRNLADEGHTVVLVTHSVSNIALCDKVIFLSEGGHLVFFGTPREALDYFQTAEFADIYKKVSLEKDPVAWKDQFKSSRFGEKYLQSDSAPLGPATGSARGSDVKTSALRQWSILTSRFTRIVSRDRRNLLLFLLQPLVIAVLIVLTFWHSSPTFRASDFEPEELLISQEVIASGEVEEVLEKQREEGSRRGGMTSCVAMMIFSAIWLGTSNAAREIIKEMPIYRRERLINLCLAPYLCSKIAVLALISFLQALLFLLVIHTGLGLPDFWINAAAFVLVFLASMMMGLVVSAAVNNTNNATAMVPLLLVPQIILSGAIMPMENVKPQFLQKVFYLAVSKWGYELMGGAILDINSRSSLETPVEALTGNLDGHWWILGGFIILFYIVATLALWHKDSRPDH